MADTPGNSDSAAVWTGDIIAGVLRTKNWSAELKATRDRLVFSGPMGVRYELDSDHVVEIRGAVARFLLWSWTMKRCVSFQHSQSGVPTRLAFRTRNTPSSEILSGLETLGFNVKL